VGTPKKQTRSPSFRLLIDATYDCGRRLNAAPNTIAFPRAEWYSETMKQLTLSIDDATYHSAELHARKAGKLYV